MPSSPKRVPLDAIVEETTTLGEAGFLTPRAAPVAAAPAPVAAAAAPEPEPEAQPEPAPPPAVRPPLVAAPPPARRPPARKPSSDAALGRLVRTSVSLYELDQAWLKEVAEQRGSVGVRRATKDFVARGLIRAVVELNPDLDLRGITLDDEDEFVERVKMALVELRY